MKHRLVRLQPGRRLYFATLVNLLLVWQHLVTSGYFQLKHVILFVVLGQVIVFLWAGEFVVLTDGLLFAAVSNLIISIMAIIVVRLQADNKTIR